VLLILLIILAIVFLGGGLGTRGHSTYGGYSTPGHWLGGHTAHHRDYCAIDWFSALLTTQ